MIFYEVSMAEISKYGKKYICYVCKCKFYDLNKPVPICPECGANQQDAIKINNEEGLYEEEQQTLEEEEEKLLDAEEDIDYDEEENVEFNDSELSNYNTN